MEKKEYVWSFVGELKNTRESMYRSLSRIKPQFVSAHAKVGALNDGAYAGILRSSIFCPAPAGYVSVDTSRLSEALEARCIPIVEHPAAAGPIIKAAIARNDRRRYPHLLQTRQRILDEVYSQHLLGSYFEEFFLSQPPYRHPPFPIVRNWDEAAKIILHLTSHKEELQELQAQCSQWWENYKVATKNGVQRLIAASAHTHKIHS